jgi:hypothetical protein
MGSALQYGPIDNRLSEIRVVILEPALSEGDEIRCRLEVTDLNTKYEALSYTWGDATKKSPISVNGSDFEVTTNLENALRNLRRKSNDASQIRKLWIDAICIDQGNNIERSEEVQRMSSIYESAEQVVIWLGRYHEPEDEKVRFRKDIWGFDHLDHASVETTQEAFQLAADLQAEYDFKNAAWQTGATSRPTSEARCWAYLSLICKRSWFQRLWVIQELMKAQQAVVVCGHVEMPWQSLEGAGETIERFIALPHRAPVGTTTFHMYMGSSNLAQVALNGTERANIMDLVHKTKDSKASDPRDRLYALRSLLGADAIDIDVDYGKTTPDVYRDWVRKRINRTKRLDVLNACLDSRGFAHELHGEAMPSWVPDLRHMQNVDLRLFEVSNGLSKSHFQYFAGGIGPCQLLGDADENLLSLAGLRVGKISKLIGCGYKFKTPVSSTDLKDAISTLEAQILGHFGSSFQEDGPLYQAYVDVLFKGCRFHNRFDKSQKPQTRYDVWMNKAPVPDTYEPVLPEDERRERFLDQFELRLSLLLVKGEFIITENGAMGIASKECNLQEGDEVWVLLGANTPFALQKLGPEGFYQLQGPCYVHGYMDGQAICNWRMGDLQLEAISIA